MLLELIGYFPLGTNFFMAETLKLYVLHTLHN
jgi:hypothetical protein